MELFSSIIDWIKYGERGFGHMLLTRQNFVLEKDKIARSAQQGFLGLPRAVLDLSVPVSSPQTKIKPDLKDLVLSWCTIADVKITFPDDIDDDTEAIRELLADADKKELSK